MKKLVGFASVLLFFFATSGRTEEYVVARIECPASVTAKINWNDKIGSNPTFGFISGTEAVGFSFKRMAQEGQTISCIYQQGLFYRYTVIRKIIKCAQIEPRILECQLKP